MNATEQRLRAELQAESEVIAPDSLRQLDFRLVDFRPAADRAGSDRRRLRQAWLAPIAAATSVAVIVAAAAIVSGHWLSAGQEPGGSGTPTSGQITGVTAFSARDVWAVGTLDVGQTRYSNLTDAPLVEHWNGSKWRRVAMPTEPGGMELNAIAGTSSDNLWAVGSWPEPARSTQAMIMHWDGHSWRRQLFSAYTEAGVLDAVAVVSPTDAWAVGQTVNRDIGALILHWNGSTWRKVKAPAAAGYQFLSDVTAISARDVWAVGSTNDPHGSTSGLYIIHWNGTSWTRVPGPRHHATQPVLESVAAVSDGTLWAAGLSDSEHTTTLLLRWNGTAWQQVAGGRRDPGDAIYGIAVISPRNVWAAGGGASSRNTVMLHWNGTTWTRITTPGITFPGRISDIAATAASDIWAVGYRGTDGNAGVPQILHWNGSKWSRSFGPASTGSLHENSSCGPYATCSHVK